MTKKYDLINLNSFLYMVDKEAECPKNTWAIFPNTRNGVIRDYEGCKATLCKWDYAANGNSNLAIIASNDKSLGLPILPDIEEDIDQIYGNYCRANPEERIIYIDFEHGYKAAKAKFQDRLPIAVEAEVLDNQVIINKWIYE